MSAAAYPHPSSAAVSLRMRRNRSSDTKCEVAVRSALHANGLRFRKGLRLTAGDVKVRPDVVFTKARVAVFVDGCYWHCCPQHGTQPQHNAAYWTSKLARNVARDRRVTTVLSEHGWQVIRAWEHEDPVAVAERVAAAVNGIRSAQQATEPQ